MSFIQGKMRLHFGRNKKSSSQEVWHGRKAADIPCRKLGHLNPEIFASYSGPDLGLAVIHDLEKDKSKTKNNDCETEIAGAPCWTKKSRKAYGICLSLYDQHPINGKISGDPVADVFAICARKNNAILIVADGVNWGEKSRLAARCATYGCMRVINEKLFAKEKLVKTTHDLTELLLLSLQHAHETILRQSGGLTTLCAAAVVPLREPRHYVVCVVNVGDSLAFVFSKQRGVQELTTGSHDISIVRDIRDAGGALGPVNGVDPELHNLSCSLRYVEPGDLVYLTTDGISDNFDPVVTKIAVAKKHAARRRVSTVHSGNGNGNGNEKTDDDDNEELEDNEECGVQDGKPEMEAHERHQYAMKEMERLLHEHELVAEIPCSAQELCGTIVQHVVRLTDPKRKVLENPDHYTRKLNSKERKQRDSMIIENMGKAPGKLDHATIVAYEVGEYRGEGDEDDWSILSPSFSQSNTLTLPDSDSSTPQSPQSPQTILYESPV